MPFFLGGIELSLQFFDCQQSAFQWRKFRRVHGRLREASEEGITFAPAVLKAELRLHHRTTLQSLERGVRRILPAALESMVKIQAPGFRRRCNSPAGRKWRQ